MATKTFQSFWYGELSSRERLCLTSFVDQGKNFELYTYDDSLSVPEGVTLKDASEIYPEEEVFTYRKRQGEGSVAVFANLFRYKLLQERGGWWVDMDVLYTGYDLPEDECYFGFEDNHKVNMAILKLPKGSDIARECLEKIRSIGKRDVASSWGKSGPKLFSRVLERRNRLHEAKMKSRAYPLHWEKAFATYLPSRREEIHEKVGESPFLHLWNEILKRVGFHRDLRPPEGSYLEDFASKLDFSWPCQEVEYSNEVVDQMVRNWERARKVQRLKQRDKLLKKIESSKTWKVVSKIRQIRNAIGL